MKNSDTKVAKLSRKAQMKFLKREMADLAAICVVCVGESESEMKIARAIKADWLAVRAELNALRRRESEEKSGRSSLIM